MPSRSDGPACFSRSSARRRLRLLDRRCCIDQALERFERRRRVELAAIERRHAEGARSLACVHVRHFRIGQAVLDIVLGVAQGGKEAQIGAELMAFRQRSQPLRAADNRSDGSGNRANGGAETSPMR